MESEARMSGAVNQLARPRPARESSTLAAYSCGGGGGSAAGRAAAAVGSAAGFQGVRGTAGSTRSVKSTRAARCGRAKSSEVRAACAAGWRREVSARSGRD